MKHCWSKQNENRKENRHDQNNSNGNNQNKKQKQNSNYNRGPMTIKFKPIQFNSLRPSDAYMRQ